MLPSGWLWSPRYQSHPLLRMPAAIVDLLPHPNGCSPKTTASFCTCHLSGAETARLLTPARCSAGATSPEIPTFPESRLLIACLFSNGNTGRPLQNSTPKSQLGAFVAWTPVYPPPPDFCVSLFVCCCKTGKWKLIICPDTGKALAHLATGETLHTRLSAKEFEAKEICVFGSGGRKHTGLFLSFPPASRGHLVGKRKQLLLTGTFSGGVAFPAVTMALGGRLSI